MVTRPLRLLGMAAIGVMAVGAAGASPASAQGLTSVTFNATGSMQTWAVPAGVTSVGVALTGGAGGLGANGAFTSAYTTTATLTIPSGVSALDIAVGGVGGAGTNRAGVSVTQGGWPNGGSSASNGLWTGGGGGGSTDIRPSGAPFTSALIVAGGAGGSGGYGGTSWGGVGGFGSVGAAAAGQAGQGHDGGAGGAAEAMPTGSIGQGGNGPAGSNSNNGSGGGGGGGWRGGAAGSAGTAWEFSYFDGGGGGGGGGIGSAVSQYVAGISTTAQNLTSLAQIQYLAVTRPRIPTMTVGTFATWTYTAGRGAIYAVTSGALPPGLSLDGNTGQVQGVPTQAGTFAFTVTASAYPDGTNAVSTAIPGTATVDTGGPASLVATSATNIGPTSATMNGAVVAGGSEVSGLACAYTTRNPGSGTIGGIRVPAIPQSVMPNSTGAATAVSCPVAGLVGNRTYYYQVQGAQLGSPVRSGTASFSTDSTAARPMVMPPSAVTQTSATANGVVSAAQNVNALFCRRSTSITGVASGTRTTASPASTKGVVLNAPLTCALTGLRPNTVYHYAVFATDAFATTMSPTLESFTTRVSPPRVGTIAARAVGSTTAVIGGTVIPTNEAVTGIACRVIASPGNPAQGTPVAATPSGLPAAPRKQAATCTLSGLAPSTTYLVRMEATDAAGTGASGNTVRFTTSASGAAPTPPGPAVAPTVDIVSATPGTGGRIAVGVRVNRAGTIRVTGTQAQGTQASGARAMAAVHATAPACSAARAVKGAGTFMVSCPLQARIRDLLRTGPVAIALRATLTTSTARATTAVRTVRVPRFRPRTTPVTG